MKYFLALLAACLMLCTHAQEGYRQEASLSVGAADRFAVDQFGNLYLLSGDELLKLDSRGKKLYSYSNPLLGEIYQVDVFNPLKPYVYFKDANRFAVLDNRLNESEQLNLTEQGFLDVQFMSFSDQQNMWLYDQAQDKLFRFNIPDRQITNQSLNITQLLGSENQPRDLVTTVHNIYMNVPSQGVMMFDATGAYQKLLPIKGLTDFDVKGNTLFGLKEGKVLLYDLETSQLLPVLFPQQNIRSLCFAGGRLYLFDGQQLYRYIAEKR